MTLTILSEQAGHSLIRKTSPEDSHTSSGRAGGLIKPVAPQRGWKIKTTILTLFRDFPKTINLYKHPLHIPKPPSISNSNISGYLQSSTFR